MDTFRAEVKRLLDEGEAPKPPAPTPPPTEPKKLYRVQVGAFSVKANADAMLARVKAAGFADAFIRTE
jgi:N-acetylmuramoyl-L-alanine amidase